MQRRARREGNPLVRLRAVTGTGISDHDVLPDLEPGVENRYIVHGTTADALSV